MALFSTRFFLFLASLALCVKAVPSTSPAVNSALYPRQCSSEDTWPQGPGSAVTTNAPPQELRTMLAEVDSGRIEAIITKLVSFGTRHTLSSQTNPVRGIGAARDWLAAEMRTLAAGAINGTHVSIEVQSFIQQPDTDIPSPTNISNIVATIQGTANDNRVYLISGHYDSRCTDIMDFTMDAPGADDDASGVALVLELVRIFSQHPPPRATIMLAAVAGEEQGLYGSAFLAQSLAQAGVDVQGMFTNDIVGASKSDEGVVDENSIRLFTQGIPSSDTSSEISQTISVGAENDSPARQLGRFVSEVAANDATQMSVRVIYRADRYLRGGDHLPFLQQGFPAARFTEPAENFAHQHQDVRVEESTGVQFGDLIEFCDFDFIARVTKVNMAAIWSLAQAPGTPKNVTIDTSVLTNNSTLNWVLDDDAGLAGYEVVWRPTISPSWTNAIPVGLVNKVTINMSKDNVAFGVRAVGKNGYRSPATFPFPG